MRAPESRRETGESAHVRSNRTELSGQSPDPTAIPFDYSVNCSFDYPSTIAHTPGAGMMIT
jgi:hypothetical protein